ncbi:MAG TPA: hypothetical protein ENH38_06025 [Nitrospirae bacterium]|nr:hypothetical protein [Nitrospirota bacterium]
MIDQSREVFNDIPSLVRTIFYIAAAISIIVFFTGSWLRISTWFKGGDDPNDPVPKKSTLGLARISLLYIFSRDCLFAKRVVERSKLRAVMLLFVYWGFIVLFIGTMIVAIDYDMGADILKGGVYLYYSLVLDISGGFFIIGLLFFILRRYIFSRGAVVSAWDDAAVLILMLIIAVSGFCIEGIRLARFNPPSMDWSPVGAAFSVVIKALIPDDGILLSLYRIFWVFHAATALFFIAFLPFSKQFHMFAAQITTLEAGMRKSKLMELVHD